MISFLIALTVACGVVPTKAEAVKAVEVYLADVQGEKVEIVRAFPPVSLKGTKVFQGGEWLGIEDEGAAVRVIFRRLIEGAEPVEVDAVFVMDEFVFRMLDSTSFRFAGESDRMLATRLAGRKPKDVRPPVTEEHIDRWLSHFRDKRPDLGEAELREYTRECLTRGNAISDFIVDQADEYRRKMKARANK